MPKLIVKSGTTQDGEYDLDLSIANFSMRENAYMASVCAAMGSAAFGDEIVGRFLANDGAAIVAVTAVMMQRAGKVPDIDVLADAKRSAYVMDFSDLDQKEPEEGDDPNSLSPSANDAPGETDAEPGTSG